MKEWVLYVMTWASQLSGYPFPDNLPDVQWKSESWFSHRANKRLMMDTDGMPLASGLAHEVFHHPGVDSKMHERISKFLKKDNG